MKEYRPSYSSTRGDDQPVDYGQAIMSGLAPDGGLYTPDGMPRIDAAELPQLATLSSYSQRFHALNGLFVGESIPAKIQQNLAEAAYGEKSKTFDYEEGQIVPVNDIGEDIFIANLAKGPTAAFKDFGMSALVPQMTYLLQQADQKLQILVATSGDTGSSAESAVKRWGGDTMSIAVISPEEGPTELQKAQMAELSGDNVLNIQLSGGTFDDAQDMVKQLKGMSGFEYLGALNSINLGRITAQIPYYFETYFQAVGQNDFDEEIDVVVPSGNFGNALAAYYSRKMGLPIRKIIVATNENNVLSTAIDSGVYGAGQGARAQVTDSPSMDITKASNFERVILDVFASDRDKVRRYMETHQKVGRVAFRDFGIASDVLKSEFGFDSGFANEHERQMIIRSVYQDSGNVIDTHTANAVAVAKRLQASRHLELADKTKIVCMSTALPVKSESAVEQALGFVPERPERLKGIEERVSRVGFTALQANDLETVAQLLIKQRRDNA